MFCKSSQFTFSSLSDSYHNPAFPTKVKQNLPQNYPKYKNYPKWALDKVEKGLTSLPDRLMMGAATMPKLPTKECKVRVTLSFPTHKVFVKVSKGSVVGMASNLTSRVALPSKTYWSPPRTKTLWSTCLIQFTLASIVSVF